MARADSGSTGAEGRTAGGRGGARGGRVEQVWGGLAAAGARARRASPVLLGRSSPNGRPADTMLPRRRPASADGTARVDIVVVAGGSEAAAVPATAAPRAPPRRSASAAAGALSETLLPCDSEGKGDGDR